MIQSAIFNSNPGEADSPLAGAAEALSHIARKLEAEPDLHNTLEGIVAAAADTVPGVEYAGISLVEKGNLRSVAPSDDLVIRIDALQYETGEGPCVDTVQEHETYRTGRLDTEPRWPTFGPAAAKLGVLSMMSFRLFTSSHTLGALNLYSSRPYAFDTDAELIGEVFAAHAAVALARSQHEAQLRSALHNRDTIAMAKGILMHSHRRTDDQAFAMLVALSQGSNRKLIEVAEWLVREANDAARSAQQPGLGPETPSE